MSGNFCTYVFTQNTIITYSKHYTLTQALGDAGGCLFESRRLARRAPELGPVCLSVGQGHTQTGLKAYHFNSHYTQLGWPRREQMGANTGAKSYFLFFNAHWLTFG